MTMFQWLQGRDDLANIDLRWPGMSQDCPAPIDSPPYQTVDTPGAGYGETIGGPLGGGSFQPRGPTDAVFLPGLFEVGVPLYMPSIGPDSGGQPSGLTGNVVTPSPNTDRIPVQVIPPFRSGTSERGLDSGDVESPGRALVSGDGLVLQRLGLNVSHVPSVLLCQPGRMPPTMGAEMSSLDAVGIMRNGVPIAAGSAIAPGELVTLFAQLGGLIGGDTVRFTIFDSVGIAAFGPVEQRKDLFSNEVSLDIVGPVGIGFYTLEATELIPLFPDNTLTFPFAVSATAPPPPTKPPGTLGSIQGIIIALAILAGVVLIAPAVKRVTE